MIKKILFLIFIVVFVSLILLYVFKPQITGFFIKTSGDYSQEMNLILNSRSNQVYNWNISDYPDSDCHLGYVKVSGSIVSNNSVDIKIFIYNDEDEKFLILSKSIPEKNQNSLITDDFALVNMSENETLSIDMNGADENINETFEENDITRIATEGDVSNFTESTNITINGTTDIEQTTGEEFRITFNDECAETCNLTSKNFTRNSYNLGFELTPNTTLTLDIIKYSLECLIEEKEEDVDEILSNIIKNETIGTYQNITKENTTICNNDCFYIKDLTGTTKAIFDKFGNLELKGVFYTNLGKPDGNDFIFINSDGDTVGWIDDVTGNLRIVGSKIENTQSYCTPPKNSFVVKDNDGNCVTYIDSFGNLWLRGVLIENSNIN